MEILKKGEAHIAKVWRCKCPLCETEVKIIEGDPEIVKYHNCSGSFREIVTWKCPVCEQEIESKTAENHFSATVNLISCKKEVLSIEERNEMRSWPGYTERPECNGGGYYWRDSSKWNSNH